MAVVTRGDKEISLRFDQFPQQCKEALKSEIDELVDELLARSQKAAPKKTGKLRGELKGRSFIGETRVAGYVSVYAGNDSNEYIKANTLEYGSRKARRIFKKDVYTVTKRGKKRRAVDRLTRPAVIREFRYLRGPLEEMQPEVKRRLQAVLESQVEAANA
jgi:hypothetical protein